MGRNILFFLGFLIGGFLIGLGCNYVDKNGSDKYFISILSLLGLIIISFITYTFLINNPSKISILFIFIYSLLLFIFGQYVSQISNNHIQNTENEFIQMTPTIGTPIYYGTSISLFFISLVKLIKK
ncbi:hypothetical protein [Flavobacterium sp.]|uniref:hypothetical protein n=1 Tax=Flavobacterium sp. TaxID=239 RepID=UPI0037502FC3